MCKRSIATRIVRNVLEVNRVEHRPGVGCGQLVIRGKQTAIYYAAGTQHHELALPDAWLVGDYVLVYLAADRTLVRLLVPALREWLVTKHPGRQDTYSLAVRRLPRACCFLEKVSESELFHHARGE